MGPKTKSSSHKSTERPTKRRKLTIGAKTSDDTDLPTPQSQSNVPSSSAWSMRTVAPDHIPPLTTLCLCVFAENLQRLAQHPSIFESLRPWLKVLPDALVPRLFATLRAICPTILSHAFIVAYLLRGPSITLTSDLPGVNKFTVSAIGDSSREQICELVLSNLEKITDETVASVVAKLPALHVLDLRGCTKVGPKTTAAVATGCPHLNKLNLNYTSVTPVSLAPILKGCGELEVLKVGGIPNWTDATVSKLWTALDLDETSEFVLPNIKSLNIRQMPLSDPVVNQLLAVCPNVERLDVSFTYVRHPPLLLNNKSLQKLSITSTRISPAHLLTITSDLPNLKSLSVGALGGGQGSSAAISNTSAMTLTDQTLRDLTDRLEECHQLEHVSLVGNTKLGSLGRKDSAIADFIRRVGRRCTRLNMAGIPSLRSSDLEGLPPDLAGEDSPRLKTLILNNTSIDDTAAPYLSSCTCLETLELAGTKVTSTGLFVIIDACPRLSQLNLTSCRGIGVVDRRRFFEVWEKEWKNR
ncbi:unnamed protein product [Somion occarium]|uniref:F-box/LRR-repeat protein 15-like leucin rich repeat domain-containing protein n=1 Tax=Somion occarium TaxID=3059160 RepID=A0ABP1CJX1_9APHY